MMPFTVVSTGLHVLSSWLMSILALLALLVSAILCLVLLELFMARGALAEAYTVKRHSSDEGESTAFR